MSFTIYHITNNILCLISFFRGNKRFNIFGIQLLSQLNWYWNLKSDKKKKRKIGQNDHIMWMNYGICTISNDKLLNLGRSCRVVQIQFNPVKVVQKYQILFISESIPPIHPPSHFISVGVNLFLIVSSLCLI